MCRGILKEDSKDWTPPREWRWDGHYSAVSGQLSALRSLQHAWDEGRPWYSETKKLLKEDPKGRDEVLATRARLHCAERSLEDAHELLKVHRVDPEGLSYCEQCARGTFENESGSCPLCGFDGTWKNDE